MKKRKPQTVCSSTVKYSWAEIVELSKRPQQQVDELLKNNPSELARVNRLRRHFAQVERIDQLIERSNKICEAMRAATAYLNSNSSEEAKEKSKGTKKRCRVVKRRVKRVNVAQKLVF